MPQQVAQALIARPARVAAVAEGLASSPLTALIAPAGYGKTSLLALALAHAGLPYARYTAEFWHGEDFVEPLVTELRRIRPDFGRLTAALAQRRPRGDEAALTAWSRRLGATFALELGHVPEPIVVVFDDVHLFCEDAAFGGFLAGAMRVLPATANFALAGRALPPLPLAEWLAQGRARIFETDDIRFEDGDVRALAQRLGRTLDDAALATFHHTYEGWAAGIALALGAPDAAVPSFGGSLPARSAYLLDANLDALDAGLIAFLEATSVFETLDADLLEREPDLRDARRSLARLERRGVMLETVRAGTIFRVHPLLREALQLRVRRRDGSQTLLAAHARAAALLEGAGRIREGLYHLEQAGDGDALARFIGAHAYDSFIAGQGERISRIAKRLEREGVEAAPVFALVEGMIARQRGEPGAEGSFLRGIAAAGARDRVGISCRMLLIEDRLARGETVAPKQIAELLEAARGSDSLVELNAHVFAGWTLAIAGNFLAARERTRRAFAIAGDDAVAHTRAASLEAYVATALGDFDGADRIMAETLRRLESSEHIVLLANTLVWYARFALLWNDPAAARDYAERGEALAQELDLSAELAGVELALAEIFARAGDRERCERACANARRRASAAWYAGDRARTQGLTAYFTARAAFASGDQSRALEIVEAALAADEATIPSAQRAALVADAAAYRTLRDGKPSVPELERAAGALREGIATDALDAAQIASAADVLGALAKRAQHAVAIVPNAAAAKMFEGYFARRASRAAQDRRLGDLVAGALGPKERARESSRLAPRASELTKREDEILQLIAAGLTNREIAQRFGLSPRTVDTHVERVLSKLGVTSRTRAVASALRLGLVAPVA
jgi:LuxR family maltose regulon positive regulatory protein